MELFSFFRKRVITLNIESHSVRGLVLRRGKVEKWGRVPLAPNLIKDDLILQPKAIGQAIQELLESLGASKGTAIVSLSGLRSVHRFLTLPRLDRNLLEEAINRAIKSEIPVPLEQLYLSWRPMGDAGDEQEFLVLAVPRDLVDAEVQALAEGGVKPDIMWLKPLALARLVNLRDALIIDLEPGSFSIILVANGVPASMRTTIPRGNGAAIEDNTRRLTEDVLRTIEFYNQGHADTPFSAAAPAFLTGELSNNAAVAELVRNGIDNPVSPLQPPVECPPDMPVASYAMNIGLALARMPQDPRGERMADIGLNILPASYRAREWPLRLVFFALAAMVALGGLFPAFQVKTRNDAETARLTGELAAVTQELRQARSVVSKEKALREEVTRAESEVKTLEMEHQTILARRGDFTDTLATVTDLLPAGVRLKSIAVTSGQVTLDGEMNSPADAVSYAKAFENQGSFPRVSITILTEKTFSITISR
ncbi:MAG: pilus assembly protein PilM [Chloroflexi bacterium]|nr:pilus assembly protein PilM [Chloroflexota bacterium]